MFQCVELTCVFIISVDGVQVFKVKVYKYLPTAGDIGREFAEPVGEGEGLTPPAPGPLSLLLQSWKNT